MFVIGIHIIITTAAGATIEFTSANDIHVKKGIHSAVDTATVKIPSVARLRESGEVKTTGVETAKQFNAGDKIEIKRGYNGELVTRFIGFIRRVNFTMPCELECEGYSYQLKRSDSIFKQWTNVSLKEVLNTLLAGTDIIIHPDTANATLDHLTIGGKNALEALEKLKERTGFIAYFINHNQLYVGLKYLGIKNQEVKYQLGWNTIKDGDLKYRAKEDQKAFYNVTYSDENGKEHHFTFGQKGGETFNYKLGYVSSHDVAKTLASVKSSNEIYEGYEGNLLTFLQPYAEPGMKAIITDENFKEREGSYMITGISERINRSGGRQTVSIGPSVSFLQTNKV